MSHLLHQPTLLSSINTPSPPPLSLRTTIDHLFFFVTLSLSLDPADAMRTSCNGCRVLRKGCTEDCIIRPCLQWIQSPDSQANATVFLAKFYGRAGLMNLINAGPQPLRPGIFKSMLYEACGRIVDPIHGSVGLLWSRNWQHCQAAVDAVLSGMPIMQFQPENAGGDVLFAAPPLQAYDIRHVSRDASEPDVPEPSRIQTRAQSKRNRNRRTVLQQLPDALTQLGENDVSGEYNDSVFSVATVEPCLANRVHQDMDMDGPDDNECELELSLGLPA